MNRRAAALICATVGKISTLVTSGSPEFSCVVWVTAARVSALAMMSPRQALSTYWEARLSGVSSAMAVMARIIERRCSRVRSLAEGGRNGFRSSVMPGSLRKLKPARGHAWSRSAR